MDGKALGIIETIGLVPAVEAGDVALKTADVSIIGSQVVGGGLVSILMTGDFSAVKASVDAGSTAAARLGEVVSMTVIARTAEGLDGILIDEARRFRCIPGGTVAKTTQPEKTFTPIVVGDDSEPDLAEGHAASVQELPDALGGLPASEGEAVLPLQALGGLPASEGEALLPFDMAELKKLKVTKLRHHARQIPDFSIARGEIKYAKKRDLLEAFARYISILR